MMPIDVRQSASSLWFGRADHIGGQRACKKGRGVVGGIIPLRTMSALPLLSLVYMWQMIDIHVTNRGLVGVCSSVDGL